MATKTYFHRTPGAKFYMPNGVPLTFSAGDGSFTTDRIDIQQELDQIADVPTSHVFTKQVVEDIGEKQMKAEVKGAAVAAFDKANNVAAGTETVAISMPQQPKPTLASVAQSTGTVPEGLQASLQAAKDAVAAKAPIQPAANPATPTKPA